MSHVCRSKGLVSLGGRTPDLLSASADYFTDHFCGAHTCSQKERQARLQTVDQVYQQIHTHALQHI